jgi:hypothetical protein
VFFHPKLGCIFQFLSLYSYIKIVRSDFIKTFVAGISNLDKFTNINKTKNIGQSVEKLGSPSHNLIKVSSVYVCMFHHLFRSSLKCISQ